MFFVGILRKELRHHVPRTKNGSGALLFEKFFGRGNSQTKILVISEAAVDSKPIKLEQDEKPHQRPITLPISSERVWALPSITTPSKFLSSGDYGEYHNLSFQQTGITPIAPQPMPVISSSGIQPPTESVLRQL